MRQGQELINHARGAVDAGNQRLQRRPRFLWRTCAIGDLRLHSDRRQRRSQLVRGGGGEMAFRIERPLDAAEQGVEGVQQGLELPRWIVGVDRAQVIAATGPSVAPKTDPAHGPHVRTPIG